MPDQPAPKSAPPQTISAGDVFLLTREASPQFVHPITVRVIRHRTDLLTYPGWTWLECYQLDARGDAVARRELYVRPEGLRRLRAGPPARRGSPPAAGKGTDVQVSRRRPEHRPFPRGPADLTEHLTVVRQLVALRAGRPLGDGGLDAVAERLDALIAQGRGGEGLTALVG